MKNAWYVTLAFGVAVAATVGVRLAGAKPDPTVVELGLPPTEQLPVGPSFDFGVRLPVLPSRPLPHLGASSEIVFSQTRDLASLSVTLDGVDLDVTHGDADEFAVHLAGVRGEGTATLLIRQTFRNGDVLTVPATPYIGSTAPSIQDTRTLISARAESVYPWGSGQGQVGLEFGEEGSGVAPTAIASTSTGLLLILDTANRRVVSQDGTVVAELPDASFTALATSTTGDEVLAISPSLMLAVDVKSGQIFQLPAIVGMLSLQSQYRIGAGSQLFLRSPLDNVYYGLGTPTAYGFEDALQIARATDVGRAWVEDGQIAAQLTLADRPVIVSFPEAQSTGASVEILDSVTGPDGRLILLVAVTDGRGWTTKLVSVSRSGQSSVDVSFDLGTSMTNYIAVSSGAVSIASYEKDGLHIRTYEVSETSGS